MKRISRSWHLAAFAALTVGTAMAGCGGGGSEGEGGGGGTTTSSSSSSSSSSSGSGGTGGNHLQPQIAKEVVGKLLYFDTNLSSPKGQACASCHDPETGYAEPHQSLPVSQGVLPWLVGNRNAPTAAYAAYSPPFKYDDTEQHYVGGQFWDGRAATLADQAKGPFLAPVEMHNADAAEVIASVKASNYANLFVRAFGEGIFDNTDEAYNKVAEAIAAYEASPEVCRFTSKFDAVKAGKDTFTAQEQQGFDLFTGTKAKCADCHSAEPVGSTPALFTDFTYDNLGVPKNPLLPFYDLPPEYNPDGKNFVDLGLGAIVNKPEENGKFKVPTLRNIAMTAPYMHNGVFGSLKEVVDFYNTRSKAGAGWDPPEVPDNMNTTELGDLGLTDAEVDAIVAFLMTLSDGHVPKPPPNP